MRNLDLSALSRLWARHRSSIRLFLIGLLPTLMLLGRDSRYFNQDDNFSQFTPALDYALQAYAALQFPWLSPADFVIPFAQSPYYAIFSPILALCGLLVSVFSLPAHWLMVFWVLIHLGLINACLVRWLVSVRIDPQVRWVALLSAGGLSYAAIYSANWYYTLPYLFSLIFKFIYWWQWLQSGRRADIQYALVSLFTAFGGNLQFWVYVTAIEILLVLPLLRLPAFRAQVIRNIALTVGLFAPYLLLYPGYYAQGWRTCLNNTSLQGIEFLWRGLIFPNIQGSPVWICLAAFLALKSLLRRARPISPEEGLARHAALIALGLLLLGIQGEQLLEIWLPETAEKSTTPAKFWFFGGPLAVLAAVAFLKPWRRASQRTLAFLLAAHLGVIAHHAYGWFAFKWRDADYRGAKASIEILKARGFDQANTRVLQVGPERIKTDHPSRTLLLNTWLGVSNLGRVPLQKGYESFQPAQTRELNQAPASDALSLAELGIGALWVDLANTLGAEAPAAAAVFPQGEVLFIDNNNALIKLDPPGKIVRCRQTDCAAQFEFSPDKIKVSVSDFAPKDEVTVKITPLPGFSVWAEGQPRPWHPCPDFGLCFEPLAGVSDYDIRYRNTPFLISLIFSYGLCATFVVWAYRRRRN